MPDIVVSEFMDSAPLADLEQRYTVHRDDALWELPDALSALVADAQGLIVRNKTHVTAQLLDAAPQLKVVGRLGVGLDNIDLDACAKRDVLVSPATGANADAVAEYVITATLALRRGAFLRSKDMLAGTWPRAALSDGHEVAGGTIGLVGFGDIGQATSRRAAALGMSVMAHDPALPDDDPAWTDVQRASFDTVIAEADVISLHVPLTDGTRHLVSADVIRRMKANSVLINTARGGVVDEVALAAAMCDGHLAGAALDVFESEPPSIDQLAPFANVDNIILTPHIAGLSAQANARVSRLTVDNVLAALSA